ncbi:MULTISPECIES: (2Fe-2S)-binding protein [Cupriavidus]
MSYTIQINGSPHTVDAEGDTPVLWVLRDLVGMAGTKFGCGMGLCGACTIHIDGAPARACLTPLESIGTRAVTTIEAVGESDAGKRIQAAWLAQQVVQCGYCQSGQIMSATALLQSNPNPSDEEIDAAMSGNICRCGTYARIRTAIREAATAGQGAPKAA